MLKFVNAARFAVNFIKVCVCARVRVCLCVCGGGNKESIYSLDLSKLGLRHFCEGPPLVENSLRT